MAVHHSHTELNFVQPCALAVTPGSQPQSWRTAVKTAASKLYTYVTYRTRRKMHPNPLVALVSKAKESKWEKEAARWPPCSRIYIQLIVYTSRCFLKFLLIKNSSKLPLKSPYLCCAIRSQQKTDSALMEKWCLAAPPECASGSRVQTGWNNYNELFAVLLGWEVFVVTLF